MSENNNKSTSQADSKGRRLAPLDALRGLIMVLMALDHANHFVAQQHSPGEYWGGPFPQYDSALAFITRLLTHPAAPGFSLLMGAGILLFARSRLRQGWSKRAISSHLALRGALLILLQFLLVNRAWELSPGGWELEIYVGVLFSLGCGMILGSVLVWLKPAYLLPLTIVLVIGSEMLAPAPEMWGQFVHETWVDKLNLFLIRPGGDLSLWSNYPALPWLELVTFGMVLGNWLLDKPREGYRRALATGGILLAAFVVIRYLDGFGNIRPREGNTWIDFLNVVKYPPSISFTLLTTGFNLVVLGLFEQVARRQPKLLQPLVVFGRVPLFFYLTHLFLYLGIGLWLTPEGTSVAAMYPYWLLGLLILYPLCLLYGNLKHRQPPNSILRFL